MSTISAGVNISRPEKTRKFDPKKVSETFDKLLTVFQEAKLTTKEINILSGNLLYALGASIEGYKEKGPSIEELEKMYYSSPTLSVALMIQGITITTWEIYPKSQAQENLKGEGNE